MGEFAGIPFEAFDFYEDLEADNSKSWWTANKTTYDDVVRAPLAALLASLEPEFGTAKVFRPHRDVRFSKDKVPYKTHQGAFVASGPATGFYVQIDAAGLFVAGGFYAADADAVARFRGAVDDDIRGPELEAIVRAAERKGYDRGGDRLKTKPRGFDESHPRIDLLRHKTLTVSKHFGSPEWARTAKAAAQVRKAWRDMTPLVQWSARVLH